MRKVIEVDRNFKAGSMESSIEPVAGDDPNLYVVRGTFPSCATHVSGTLPEVSRKGDRDRSAMAAWHCPAETRSLTAGNAVSDVCIVTTHVEFRKRARRDYVYPMIQRYSADRRPSIPRSIRIVERERANERQIRASSRRTNVMQIVPSFISSVREYATLVSRNAATKPFSMLLISNVLLD